MFLKTDSKFGHFLRIQSAPMERFFYTHKQLKQQSFYDEADLSACSQSTNL